MIVTTSDGVRAEPEQLGGAALARLREELLADRAAQAVLAAESQAMVSALTGQRDTDSVLEREMAEVSAARAQDAIDDIDVALAAMAAGSYGRCSSCGEAIPLERLEAIPRARRCVGCSRRH